MKSKDVCLDIFGFRQCGKIFLYPPVINAEELVCPGSHVDVIRLALCPFLVHESINGIIHRGTLDDRMAIGAKLYYHAKVGSLRESIRVSAFIYWQNDKIKMKYR